jgi:hypothetical protein
MQNRREENVALRVGPTWLEPTSPTMRYNIKAYSISSTQYIVYSYDYEDRQLIFHYKTLFSDI